MNGKSQGRVVAFGEILLRLSPPGRELLLQTPKLDVWTGGAETNVAVALARLGHDVAMVSAVPDNPLGHAAIASLRSHGVDCRHVRQAPGRMGLYFAESGAGLRATEVHYDRAGSSFATVPAESWEWDRLLAGADRLHLSGITPALGPNGTNAAIAAADAAKRLGVAVSFDGNYRSKLWGAWDGRPRETLRALVERADILFGNHRDIALLLNRTFTGEGRAGRREAAVTAFTAFPALRLIASTSRALDSVDHHRLSARVDTLEGGFETDTTTIPSVVDRVGTGDAFAAGVLDAERRGLPPLEIARVGIALSLFKHSVPGDMTPIDRQRLDHFLTGSLDAHR